MIHKFKIILKPGENLLMARSSAYFGNTAFGEITATKIALCHQINYGKNFENEKNNGSLQVKSRQGGREQTTGESYI